MPFKLTLLSTTNQKKKTTPSSENPWLDVIHHAILVMKNPHYIKVVRALALGQVVYGGPTKDKSDGYDYWLKAAHISLDVAENSSDQHGWSFSGIGFEETWETCK